ncbi:MAG: hypothetical protein M9894_14125 [Planctomycetes bacterium]|nr:hypothetical protein [Planctomycetota bacterium]
MSERSPDEEPPLTFFVDTCLGTKDVPNALRAAGVTVACLIDHFRHDEEDAVWLPSVGQRGWVVLTKDKWIRRRSNEIEALKAAGVAAFILSARGLSGQQMGAAFVAALPGMQRALRVYARGSGHYFVARVTASGDVDMLEGAVRRASIRRD